MTPANAVSTGLQSDPDHGQTICKGPLQYTMVYTILAKSIVISMVDSFVARGYLRLTKECCLSLLLQSATCELRYATDLDSFWPTHCLE